MAPTTEDLQRWHVPALSAVLGAASALVIGAATVTGTHDVWVFLLWVLLTAGAVVSGATVLFRVRRGAGRMAMRRAASFGLVVAVLCGTLGLAVYSNTRVHDCPATGPCSPAAPGKGQRQQQP
jgi:hypothetical protein